MLFACIHRFLRHLAGSDLAIEDITFPSTYKNQLSLLGCRCAVPRSFPPGRSTLDMRKLNNRKTWWITGEKMKYTTDKNPVNRTRTKTP